MSKLLRNKKELRKAYEKQQRIRRRITFSMFLLSVLGVSFFAFGSGKTNVAVASAKQNDNAIVLEGTDKSISEYVEPFINKQFSDGGVSSDNKVQDVVFFGNTNDYHKAVRIVFSIKDNKARIISITADGESVKNIEDLYKLC